MSRSALAAVLACVAFLTGGCISYETREYTTPAEPKLGRWRVDGYDVTDLAASGTRLRARVIERGQRTVTERRDRVREVDWAFDSAYLSAVEDADSPIGVLLATAIYAWIPLAVDLVTLPLSIPNLLAGPFAGIDPWGHDERERVERAIRGYGNEKLRVEIAGRRSRVRTDDAGWLEIELAEPARAALRAGRDRVEVRFRDGDLDVRRTLRAPLLARIAGAAAPTRQPPSANASPLIALLTPEENAITRTTDTHLALRAVVKDEAGIARWKVEHNGRRVAHSDAQGRGVRVQPSHPGATGFGTVLTLRERIALVPGTNHIAVSAWNRRGVLASVSAEVVRARHQANAAALVVGIDRYQDPAIGDLRYAERDARAFAEFLRGPGSPIPDPANVVLLLGSEATTVEIRKRIERHLVRVATHPDDMAILYFAGHGFSDGQRTVLAGNDTELQTLRATGIGAAELAGYWADIRAERKILIADACHSGGLPGMRGSNDVNTSLSGAIAGRGTVSFLASNARQQSVESPSLQHGVFTYALLEGLRLRADVDGDGRVSAKELASHLDRTVPALARREGHDQHPIFRADTEGQVFLTQ